MNPFTKKEKIYIFFVALFSTLVILANLATAKWVWIPLYASGIPAGLLLYPLTFLINDLVLEIYGTKLAKMMVYFGFVMAIITWGCLGLIFLWPEGGKPSTLSFSPQFFGASIFSSMAAYLVGQLTDISTYDWIGKKTGSRYLWLRSGGSTLISQALDTVIVNGLLFLFFVPQPPLEVLHLTVASYLYKAVIAVMMVPLFYLAVRSIKQTMGTYGVYQT